MRRALIVTIVLVVGLVGAFAPSASGEPTDATEPPPTIPSPDTVPETDPPSTSPPPDPSTTTTSTTTTTSVPPPPAPSTTAPTTTAPPETVGPLADHITVPAASVNEAPEFATRAWSDPWDMSNPDDLLRNFGPTYKVLNPRFGNGVMSFALTGNGYVSPLWTGFPGSLQMGRDGTLGANSIAAGTYKNVSIRMWTSAPLSNAAMFWSNCNRHIPSCEGGMSLQGLGRVAKRWQTYTFALKNQTQLTRFVAWAGSLHGLRLALNPTPGTRPSVLIDWIRLYQPGQSGSLSGVTDPSSLYYAGTATPCTQLLGSGNTNTDLSALPPGSYRFSSSSNCTSPSDVVEIVSRPTPVVTVPNLQGENDYATRILKNPWNFTGPGDVLKTGNVCSSSYSQPAGAYSAYNCAAHGYINDPSVFLRVGTGNRVINPRVYHRATVVFHYDGAFDLHDSCGGGTIGRLMWLNTRYPGKIIQTKDWVTYTDRLVYTFDLDAPSALLNEEGAGNKYPWRVPAGYYATTFRWDPNEDRCSRRFRLYDVKLTADHTPVAGKFNIRWRDARAMDGDQVYVFVLNTSVPGSKWQQIASRRPNSATGAVYQWNTAGYAKGKYRVLVRVYRNGGALYGDFTSTGPVTK